MNRIDTVKKVRRGEDSHMCGYCVCVFYSAPFTAFACCTTPPIGREGMVALRAKRLPATSTKQQVCYRTERPTSVAPSALREHDVVTRSLPDPSGSLAIEFLAASATVDLSTPPPRATALCHLTGVVAEHVAAPPPDTRLPRPAVIQVYISW